MAKSSRHGGFRRDHEADILDIAFDGESSVGFASFETLYGAPTVARKAPLGHGVFDPMGGRWRYCKAGAAITNPLLGCIGYAGWTNVTPGATAVDGTSIACTGSSDATCTEDQYADGTIIIGAAAANRRFYHIKGNTASATTTTTLTLHHPVRYAIAGTEWGTINPNPWRDVRTQGAAGNTSSVVCMPLQPVTNAYYFWGKTRGPIFGIVTATTPGAAAHDRLVLFNGSDGALIMADESWNAGNSKQICGWLMMNTAAGGDQGIWLQIE